MVSNDCIFCKIIAGELPATKVYEDDEILAFKDIHPKASVHLLIVPKLHVATLNDFNQEHSALLAKLLLTIPKIAQQQGLEGYRVVINNGPGSGQIVFHLHLHILGGKSIPSF